ncbi:MAG: hypothetical protein PWP28_85 [Oceanotoga sp.]|nr:hypothetical protein [Oceanotoga sp.]
MSKIHQNTDKSISIDWCTLFFFERYNINFLGKILKHLGGCKKH